ncbi:MAG TPA: HEAT repeat domain-containing protein [Pyrinomonadaceae bacterium]|jgi:HEAT repeat protein
MKTLQEVRNILSDIEPDEGMYAKLDVEDIPHLKTLLGDEEAWMASRAVFALSRLETEEAHNLVIEAAKDSRSAVRVAAAVSSSLLPAKAADKLLDTLIADKDVSVKRFAITSMSKNASAKLVKKLADISANDANEFIRTVSADKLKELK